MTSSLLLTLAFLAGAPGTPMPLYPGKAPLAVVDSPSDQPTITPFLAEKPNGAAVVVCPGGGYGALANDHEGKQIAEYFNGLGIHAFVLKYRIVQKDRPGPLMEAPNLDVNRAIRTVRAKAKDYGIDANRIGLMGFSAGGHLASTGGTKFADHPKPADDIDKASARPDFLILCYPVITMETPVTHGGSRNNLIGKEPKQELIDLYSSEKHVTEKTPPTFIFHTDEDKGVLPENAIRFYLALKKAKVPAELHIYEKGRHGIGLGKGLYAEAWSAQLTNWLKDHANKK